MTLQCEKEVLEKLGIISGEGAFWRREEALATRSLSDLRILLESAEEEMEFSEVRLEHVGQLQSLQGAREITN